MRDRASECIRTTPFAGPRLQQIQDVGDILLTQEGASSPTIRRDLFCLSSMFTHAIVDIELLDMNPVPVFMKRQKRRGRLTESPPRTRFLSHAEQAALLAACEKDLAEQIAFAIDTELSQAEQFSPIWPRARMERREGVATKEIAKGKKESAPCRCSKGRHKSWHCRHGAFGPPADRIGCSAKRMGAAT